MRRRDGSLALVTGMCGIADPDLRPLFCEGDGDDLFGFVCDGEGDG